MNNICLNNEIRNNKTVSFEIVGFEGDKLEMKNEGIDFQNDVEVSIDLDGEKLEGTFQNVYESLCLMLEVEKIEFCNVEKGN